MFNKIKNRVNQFGYIAREQGIQVALYRTIDFGCNAISRRVINTTNELTEPTSLKAKKILFIEAVGRADGWGLGDGIFRTPIMEFLGSQGELHVLTREKRTQIFDNNPNIYDSHNLGEDRTLGSVVSLIKRLREENFEHIISLDPSWKMHILMYLIKTKIANLHISTLLPGDELNNTNLIKLFMSKIKLSLGIQPEDTIPDTKIYPTKSPDTIRSQFLKGTNYIGVNIGAKSGLRHFRAWAEVFQSLKDNLEIPNNIVFVLVGKDGVNNIDLDIIKLFPHGKVLNFCNQVTLSETYDIISQCNGGFIGMDGGNVNAAIALRHITNARVIPIYNAVNPDLRIPSSLPISDCATIPCPAGDNCFTTNLAMYCHINGQLADDNINTPPCLKDQRSVDTVYNMLLSLIKSPQ